MNHREAKEKLEQAIQDFIIADFGEDHYMGDYIVVAHVVPMATGIPIQHNFYLHDGRGAPHSLSGLVNEAEDWVYDLKTEDRKAASDENDN